MKRKKLTRRLLAAILPACAGVALLGAIATAPARADFVLAQRNGDVNASGAVDVSDGIYLLNYLFNGGPEPIPMGCEPDTLVYFGEHVHNGNVNGRGGINISDPIYLLQWLFNGGPAPVEACPVSG
jgi:hypothetical protein